MKIKIVNSKYPLAHDYYITDNGEVITGIYDRELSTALDKDGYVKVRLVSEDGKRHRYSVHRLVMENFKPCKNMELLQINHIDGNKQNNCLKNLEWCTCKENISHVVKNNLRHDQKGENNNANKYSEKMIKEIINLLQTKKYSCAEIDRKFNLSKDFTASIKRKDRWAHLTKDIDFN